MVFLHFAWWAWCFCLIPGAISFWLAHVSMNNKATSEMFSAISVVLWLIAIFFGADKT